MSCSQWRIKELTEPPEKVFAPNRTEYPCIRCQA